MDALCRVVINGEKFAEEEQVDQVLDNVRLIHRYQQAKIDLLKMSRESKYDKTNTQHESDLMKLWTNLKPD
jgi:hypothetical protein